MNKAFTGIDVFNCVQGNTARDMDALDRYSKGCVVFDFSKEAYARSSSNNEGPDLMSSNYTSVSCISSKSRLVYSSPEAAPVARKSEAAPAARRKAPDNKASDRKASDRKASDKKASNKKASARKASDRKIAERRTHNRRRKAERVKRVMAVRACVLAALLAVIFISGGIVSSAHSRKAPECYKYYDTVTVAYQENLLDIVQRYDNRDFYETQFDYVEELCKINNIAYDGTGYPEVAPGTRLVVPYYSADLK